MTVTVTVAIDSYKKQLSLLVLHANACIQRLLHEFDSQSDSGCSACTVRTAVAAALAEKSFTAKKKQEKKSIPFCNT